MAARRPDPEALAGDHDVTTGSARLERDDTGWLVTVNGVPSSHVADDPTVLEFEYVRWTGVVLDTLREAAERLDTVHVGGAGCTLARYVAATRPGSRQVVLEVDEALVDLVREAFGRPRTAGFRLRAADGLAGLRELERASYDVVVRDAFAGDVTPAHLTTTGFVQEVASVLRPGGVYVANVADRPGLGLTKAEVATALTVWRHVLLVGETAHLRGRRYGNVLLVASDAELPVADLTRRLAADPVPTRVVPPGRTRELAAGTHPLTG